MRYLFLLFISYATLGANGGVLAVDWSSISQSQQKATLALPKVLKDSLKNTHLPVYLTQNLTHDKSMRVITDANFYSISFELAGASLLFEGDKTFQESVSTSNPEFQKMVQSSSDVEYIHSEGMMSVEFSRHGLNYVITVECEEPKKDERCREENFMQSLYNRLILVGGRP